MPIRLNLLAEAQAEEELRRRDPVKQVIWLAVLGVAIVLGWSSSLHFRALLIKGETNRLDAQLNAQTNEFRRVLENQAKLNDVRHKLASLRQLATNRFLQGSLLNALQQAIVDDVQLTRFRAEQVYVLLDEIKAATNSDNVVTVPRPASATEKIALLLDAKDSGANPGDRINQFKQAVGSLDYFKQALGATNEVRLANLGAVQPLVGGKPFVPFSLECRLPERKR